ncbi:hypothetical protein [Gulosibacter bifidus]|uniref:Uncharacterized protein n=1 Tax=Gulosibacter bifidus TaxID=272239 RepID=A0ABW5RGQ6_9MICO|nr:hypothetical protein [Gulosibacter bifidus]
MGFVDALYLAASATPSPTPAFDPVDVTPGPAGFFATIGLMLAVGLIAMGLMRQSTRANARYDVRERVEREAEAEAAAAGDAAADTTAETDSDASR